MTGWPLAAGLVAAVLVFWTLGAYNRLVALRNAIHAAWQPVDSAQAQRSEAADRLLAAWQEDLPGGAEALGALRGSQAETAAAAERMRAHPLRAEAADAWLSANEAWASASAGVLALEAELPASDTGGLLRALFDALRDAEPPLQFARQSFNAAVQPYNDAVRQWPTRLLARVFGFGTAGRL